MADISTPWPSIYICGIGAFIQAVQFSIYFSSMWPYIKKLDPTITESFLGYMLAAYSVAQCIIAPLMGYWSNRIKQVRLPLLTGFSLMMLGNLVYLTLPYVPVNFVPAVMMLSRTITGAGTANQCLIRAYVATASSFADRAQAIATVSGGIAVGSMAGPALQLLFVPLGEVGLWIGPFNMNIYNAPAVMGVMIMIGGLILITFFFEEHVPICSGVDEAKSESAPISPDLIAVAVCAGTRFSQVFMQTTIETVGSPYSMMMFGFDKEAAVTYNAAAHAVSGIVAIILYVFFIFTDAAKYIRERISAIASLSVFLAFFTASYSWDFLPENVDHMLNGSDGGCDAYRFTWCDSLTKVYPFVYYTGYVLAFGIATSFINISVTTLYSKIIGPRRQGTLQGVYQMGGSLGRMFAPLIMSRLYTMWGPRSVWCVEGVEIALNILLWMVFLPRMIPFGAKAAQVAP